MECSALNYLSVNKLEGAFIMSPREDQQSRKQHILEAAAVLFAERGYYKTTTADVARALA